MKLFPGTIISEPGGNPSASIAISTASVPLPTPMQYGARIH
jgi:hypothetical protein